MKKKFLLLFFSGVLIASLIPLAFLLSKPNSQTATDVDYTPEPYESSELQESATPDEDVLGTTNYNSIKIPVLMYHNIAAVPTTGSKSYRGLFVSPSMFEKQMKYLHDQGYKTLTPDEYYEILKSGKTPKQKLVLITFDDGSKGQYTSAYPVLKKYEMTATFFIIAKRSPITAKQLKKMSDNGMIIASHTDTHPDITKLKKKSQIKTEITDSKKVLEKITGETMIAFAYPGCVGYKQSETILKDSGYKLAFSCGRSIYANYKTRYNISRVHVFSDMTSFKNMLKNGL